MGAWYGGVPCIEGAPLQGHLASSAQLASSPRSIEGSLYKWYVALMTAGIDVALDIKVI